MSDLEQTLLTEQLHWYRLQRHDFMNYWQVIMGYLQLKQSDKALEYMHDTIRGLATEQKVSQIAQPIVCACLLGFIIRLRLEEIETQLSFPGEMKEEGFWKDLWREEYAEQLYAYTMDSLQEARIKVQRHKDPVTAEIVLKKQGIGLRCEMLLICRGIVLTSKVCELPG